MGLNTYATRKGLGFRGASVAVSFIAALFSLDTKKLRRRDTL